jgi:hypothetical protein
MFDLKTDPKFPYHFLISVGIRDMYSENRGKLFLKHGPLFFTNDDVERLQSASMLSVDKLFPTNKKEAIAIHGVGELINSIHCMLMAAAANMCTMHHFSSDILIEEDYWETFVNLANKNEHERRKLISAVCKSRGFI